MPMEFMNRYYFFSMTRGNGDTSECHEGNGNSVEASAMTGHFGRDKTVALLSFKVFIPKVKNKV